MRIDPRFLALIAFLPAVAQAQHVHGHAEMQVAVDGDTLQIVLEAPSGDIVGFEREAETDEERQQVAGIIEALEGPDALLVLNEAAGCEIASSEAEFEVEGGHAEFHVTQMFDCTDISALGTAETPLMASYPSLAEIEATIVTGAGASLAELEPDENSLEIPSN